MQTPWQPQKKYLQKIHKGNQKGIKIRREYYQKYQLNTKHSKGGNDGQKSCVKHKDGQKSCKAYTENKQ